MSDVDFIDEDKLEAFAKRRRVDSNSTIFKLILKTGLVRNVDNVYYVCIFISVFFFMLSAVIVATSL